MNCNVNYSLWVIGNDELMQVHQLCQISLSGRLLTAGEAMCAQEGAGQVVLSIQFCCEPKTVLKDTVYDRVWYDMIYDIFH